MGVNMCVCLHEFACVCVGGIYVWACVVHVRVCGVHI